MPCGTRCCQPRERCSRPHSTPARRATPTLGRGSRSASSWRRGGGAAGCRSCSKRPDPGVRSLGSPAGEAAEALPPPPFSYPRPLPRPPPPPTSPASGGTWQAGAPTPPQGGGSKHPPRGPEATGRGQTAVARRPSPPPSRPPPPSPHPPPRPTRGTTASLPPPPAAAARCALHAWPADMQSCRDSHRAPPGRPVSLKIGPQIKSTPSPTLWSNFQVSGRPANSRASPRGGEGGCQPLRRLQRPF